MNNRKEYFEGNRSLKATSIPVGFTGNQISEYDKCLSDPIYFIENYCKIVSLDDGPVLFKMYPYQKRMIEAMHNNRKTVAKLFRQAGKSSIVAAYICWFVTFKADQTVALLANKASTAREIFSRVQYMYQELPWWIQVGVQEWSKTKFKLGNDTVCFMAASSPDNIRGQSISLLFCVSAKTKITLRNKKTGEIKEVTMSDVENMNSLNIIYPNSSGTIYDKPTATFFIP